MKILSLLLTLVLLGTLMAEAQTTYTAVATGDWNTAGTWDANGVPPTNLPATDAIVIDCGCDVTYDDGGDLTILGTLTIGAFDQLDMDGEDLFIGDAANPNATLTNNGTLTNVNKLENGGASLALGDGPFVYNTGTINADNLRIGTGTGGGFFTNTSTGVVNVSNPGQSIHMDGTLCNTGNFFLQGTFRNHGGFVDCCGFIEAPDVMSDTKNSRPGTFMCIDICAAGGVDPTFDIGGTAYDSIWVDVLEPVDISTDEEFTFICGKNQLDEAGPQDQNGPGGVIDNLSMWLKANERTNTTGDGDGVMIWSDFSRFGNFVQQLVVANQPTFRNNDTDNINFNPVVDFDGSDDVMSDVTGILGTTTLSNINIYSVVETDVVQNSFIFEEQSTPQRLAGTTPYGDNNVYWDAGGTGGDYNLTAAWGGSPETPYLWSFLYSSTTGQTVPGAKQIIQRNSLNLGTDNTASSLTGTVSQLNIASDLTDYYDGKVAEIAIYTGPINPTQHSKIESYFAIKYGITLDNSVGGTDGDYIASDATLLWDADVNVAYHNDVTGIGRDDDAGLDQQKSISINGDDIVLMDKGGPFPSDRGFVLWGNNDGASTLTTTNVDPNYDTRLEREWKVGVGGSPGAVTLKMIYAFQGFDIDIALLTDADGDFTSGATSYAVSSTSGDTVIFDNITFSDGEYFTLAIAQASPGHVLDELRLWLRADAGTTGDPTVTAWDDQSGNAFSFTAGNIPQLQTNAINFNKAIDFDGAGDQFNSTTNTIMSGQIHTVFAVTVPDELTTNRNIIGSTTGFIGFTMYHDNSGTQRAFQSFNNIHGLGPAYSTGNPSIGVLRYNEIGLDNKSIINGVEAIDNTISDPNHGSAPAIQIAADQGSFNGFSHFDGRIAEVIMYQSELTDTEIDKVESYLAIRYGITLDDAAGGTAGDYQASDATLLWDADVNTTYHNDVAGIGRDDDSALDQQRSISSNSDAVVVMEKGSAFSNDFEFILWGNDDGAVTLDPTGKHPDYDNILQRTWKTAVTGTPGNVTVRVVFANGGLVGNYALHVDSDANFTAGATNFPATSIEGDTISFANVALSDGQFFTMGSVQRGPGDVTNNLVMWLKANKGTSTTTDNTTVSQWTDQSGSGNNATTAAAANEPTFRNNFFDNINFNPTIEFDDSDDRMMIDLDVIKDGTEYSVLVVGQRFSTDPNYAVGSTANGTDNHALHLGYPSSTTAIFGQGNNDQDIDPVDAFSSPDSPYLLFGELNSFGHYLTEIRDDNFRQSGNPNTTGLAGTVQDWIGYYYNGITDEYYDGLISEVIVYSDELNADEEKRVFTYLCIKYGFWYLGDFVASDGALLWDLSANLDYLSDVAGIGRDDGSVLDQRKSINNSKEGMVIMEKGSSFVNDLDFLIWGNDDDPIVSTVTGASPYYNSILDRTWKATVIGTPGNVTVQMVYPNDGITGNYGLLIDADEDFTAGATNITPSSFSGDTVIFTNVPFSDGDFFTLGLNLTAPGYVTADLGLWLKANTGTNTTTDGDGITSWADQSVGGWDATGTGDAVYNASFANFNPSIYFDNDTQPIQGSIERTNGTASTVFVVANMTDDKDPLFESGDASNRAYFFGKKYAGKDNYNLPKNETTFWSVSDPGGSVLEASIYENGSDSYTSDKDGNSTDWTTGGTYYVGDDDDAGGGPGATELKGDIAEVIFYDQQLSAADQQRVETYLAIKYGISMTNDNDGDGITFEAPNGDGIHEGDYVIRGGTVVWDASVNSAYHNDVTGIGRDDYSALFDQRKSFNISNNDIVLMDKGAAFSNDLDYVIWGHNNLATTLTTTGRHPDFDEILNRKWKAGINGTPGTVTVRMIFSGNTGRASNYSIHVDPDGDFTDGNAINYPASSVSGDTVTFANVSFADGDFFTLGQVVRAPGNVSTDLTFWLKADEGLKNGGSTVTSGVVDEWEESSGNASFTEIDVDNGSPLLSSNVINYNPAVYFDGIDDKFQKNNIDADKLFSDQNNTIFYLVHRYAKVNPTEVLGGWESDFGATPPRLAYFENKADGKITTNMYADANRAIGGTIDKEDRDVMVTVYSDAIGRSLSFDGFEDQTQGPGSMLVAGNQGDFALGDRPGGASNYSENYTAELVIYNDALSELEIRKVESYMAVKYAINLDNSGGGTDGDYIASDGTTFWDADNPAGYQNEIIAIGRDDKSDLYQRQSHHQDDSLKIYIDNLAADNASNVGAISNDISFITIGHDGGKQRSQEVARPPGIKARFERVWKVTNTNFDDDFSLEFEWNNVDAGGFDISMIRLLVDDDANFSDADIFSSADGLTFNEGSIIVGGISTAHIPKDATRFITIGSVSWGVPLPVELISFEAKVTEKQTVALSWQTASEINNDFFTIERSKDASTWHEVRIIDGSGNSSEKLSYSSEDARPYSGMSYYRLKQTDFDGKFSYSDIEVVSLGQQEENDLKIYPNPSRDLMTIEANVVELSDFAVYNIYGQNVMNLLKITDQNAAAITIDISRLADGVYTLKTRNYVSKIIKQ